MQAERAAAEAARDKARQPRQEDDDGPATSPRTLRAVFQPTFAPPHMEHLRGLSDADRGRVLRFYCVWDNTKNIFGEKLAFALHYYMADGTVEIREVHMRNSGREPFPLLLSRRKLPKTTPPVCELGAPVT